MTARESALLEVRRQRVADLMALMLLYRLRAAVPVNAPVPACAGTAQRLILPAKGAPC